MRMNKRLILLTTEMSKRSGWVIWSQMWKCHKSCEWTAMIKILLNRAPDSRQVDQVLSKDGVFIPSKAAKLSSLGLAETSTRSRPPINSLSSQRNKVSITRKGSRWTHQIASSSSLKTTSRCYRNTRILIMWIHSMTWWPCSRTKASPTSSVVISGRIRRYPRE